MRRKTKVSQKTDDDEFCEVDDDDNLNLADVNEDLEPEDAAALTVAMQSRSKIFNKIREGEGRAIRR